jgi:hypothetical protein
MGEMKNAYKVLAGKPEGENNEMTKAKVESRY